MEEEGEGEGPGTAATVASSAAAPVPGALAAAQPPPAAPSEPQQQQQLALQPHQPSAAPPAPGDLSTPEGQLAAARARGIRLPVLGRSADGRPLLRFSELFAGAPTTASGADLRPPPLLPAREAAAKRAAALRATAPETLAAAAEAAAGEGEEGVLRAAEVEARALQETYTSEEDRKSVV